MSTEGFRFLGNDNMLRFGGVLGKYVLPKGAGKELPKLKNLKYFELTGLNLILHPFNGNPI